MGPSGKRARQAEQRWAAARRTNKPQAQQQPAAPAQQPLAPPAAAARPQSCQPTACSATPPFPMPEAHSMTAASSPCGTSSIIACKCPPSTKQCRYCTTLRWCRLASRRTSFTATHLQAQAGRQAGRQSLGAQRRRPAATPGGHQSPGSPPQAAAWAGGQQAGRCGVWWPSAAHCCSSLFRLRQLGQRGALERVVLPIVQALHQVAAAQARGRGGWGVGGGGGSVRRVGGGPFGRGASRALGAPCASFSQPTNGYRGARKAPRQGASSSSRSSGPSNRPGAPHHAAQLPAPMGLMTRKAWRPSPHTVPGCSPMPSAPVFGAERQAPIFVKLLYNSRAPKRAQRTGPSHQASLAKGPRKHCTADAQSHFARSLACCRPKACIRGRLQVIERAGQACVGAAANGQGRRTAGHHRPTAPAAGADRRAMSMKQQLQLTLSIG